MYKERKCFLQKYFILLVLLFVPLFFVLKSDDVSAASLGTSGFDLYYKPNSSASTSWQNNILYSDFLTIQSSGSIYKYQFFTPSVQAGGNYATIHFETNLVASKFDFPLAVNPWVNLSQQNILVCNSYPSGATIISKNLSWATTPWFNYYDNSGYSSNNTLTFYGDLALSGFTMNTNYSFICAIGSDTYSFYDGTEWTSSYILYFEQNPMTIEWSNDHSIALNQMMVNQNNTIINQNNEYYQHEYQAEDNISNQNTGDINGATNNVTTNLLGIIQAFVTELGTLRATNCFLDMPFPDFMGGTTRVNICQGRDVLGSFIAVISSVALIGFYIPLAFVLIRMIYNEIRSWTNG